MPGSRFFHGATSRRIMQHDGSRGRMPTLLPRVHERLQAVAGGITTRLVHSAPRGKSERTHDGLAYWPRRYRGPHGILRSKSLQSHLCTLRRDNARRMASPATGLYAAPTADRAHERRRCLVNATSVPRSGQAACRGYLAGLGGVAFICWSTFRRMRASKDRAPGPRARRMSMKANHWIWSGHASG
jgi:hypothetical protein